MTIEKIDQSKESDSYTELIEEIKNYLQSNNKSIKDRLQLERKLSKYQESNSPDWLLNIIISVYKSCQTKENN
jgi:uncharacterized membrane protein YheB (UPF0754 family)